MKSKLFIFYKMFVAGKPSFLFLLVLMGICAGITSCKKDIDIDVPANKPLLVVEAYINNEMPYYNYVILTRSLDYLSTNFQSTPVKDAVVTITEGDRAGDGYVWDSTSTVQLKPIRFPGMPEEFSSVYFDPRLAGDSAHALLGVPGKSYLLHISEGGKEYTAVSTLLPPVQIDSLTTGYGYTDTEDSVYKLRITNNYQDPDTLNNTQLYFYRFSENRNNFGWGSFYGNRYITLGTDELTNGQYIRLTHPRGFVVGDTVEYHMASVTRDVYEFWNSFNNARNNGGPFATPVVLKSNITGTDVTGCFSGMSMSSKTIIIK